MAKYRITGELDYVMGHLRYGHMELEVDKEEWDKLSTKEQKEWLDDEGDFILDDYSLEDRGSITEITKEEC